MKGVIANLAADAIKKLGRNLVGAVKSVVSSGIEFESAFAGVKRQSMQRTRNLNNLSRD